jgi:squalene cyclase
LSRAYICINTLHKGAKDDDDDDDNDYAADDDNNNNNNMRMLSWPILGLIHESGSWWWTNGDQFSVSTVPGIRYEKTFC